MKALSVKQPFASLILEGKKTIETRTWATDYRGPLLICASLKPHSGLLLLDGFAHDAKGYASAKNLPTGVMLCVVDLVDCRKMHISDHRQACCAWYPELWAWELANVRPVQPSEIRGQLRLFEVEDWKIGYLHSGR